MTLFSKRASSDKSLILSAASILPRGILVIFDTTSETNSSFISGILEFIASFIQFSIKFTARLGRADPIRYLSPASAISLIDPEVKNAPPPYMASKRGARSLRIKINLSSLGSSISIFSKYFMRSVLACKDFLKAPISAIASRWMFEFSKYVENISKGLTPISASDSTNSGKLSITKIIFPARTASFKVFIKISSTPAFDFPEAVIVSEWSSKTLLCSSSGKTLPSWIMLISPKSKACFPAPVSPTIRTFAPDFFRRADSSKPISLSLPISSSLRIFEGRSSWAKFSKK